MQTSFPPTPSIPAPAGDKKGLAIAGFVLGIINMCAWLLPICGGPVAIVGLVLSILGIKSSQKTLAIIGVVLSALGLLLTIVNAILGAVISSSDLLQQIQSAIGGF